MSIRTR